MPLNKKGEKIMSAMKKEYGGKKGERVFYASRNKGRIKGVEYSNKHASAHARTECQGVVMMGKHQACK